MVGTLELLTLAGSPAALIALGINLFRFEVKGEKLGILVMCALKLLAMPAAAFLLAKLMNLPPLAAGVVVLFAAMPSGANAYIFAAQYQRLVNPVSGGGCAGHVAGCDDVAGGGGDDRVGVEVAARAVTRSSRCIRARS